MFQFLLKCQVVNTCKYTSLSPGKSLLIVKPHSQLYKYLL